MTKQTEQNKDITHNRCGGVLKMVGTSARDMEYLCMKCNKYVCNVYEIIFPEEESP